MAVFLTNLVLNLLDRDFVRARLSQTIEDAFNTIYPSDLVQNFQFYAVENCDELSIVDDLKFCDQVNETETVDNGASDGEFTIGIERLEGIGRAEILDLTYDIIRDGKYIYENNFSITAEMFFTDDLNTTTYYEGSYSALTGVGSPVTFGATMPEHQIEEAIADIEAHVYFDCEREGLFAVIDSIELSEVGWIPSEDISEAFAAVPGVGTFFDASVESAIDVLNDAITEQVNNALEQYVIDEINEELDNEGPIVDWNCRLPLLGFF